MAAPLQPLAVCPDRSTLEEKPAASEFIKKQLLSAKNERTVSPNSSPDDAATGYPREAGTASGPISLVGDSTICPPISDAHQAQPFYCGGIDNAAVEWDDYFPYVNAECLEMGSPGVYSDSSSLMYHTGYGYNPQMPYGPYSPVTAPLPSVGAEPQLYSAQQFPYSDQPYYQQQGDGLLFGPRFDYAPIGGSLDRGSYARNPWTFGFHDLQQGLDGLRSGGLWSRPTDRQRSYAPLSPTVSPQPIGAGSFGQQIGIDSYEQRPLAGFGLGSGSNSNPYRRDNMHISSNGGSTFQSFLSVPNAGLEENSRGWFFCDDRQRRWKGNSSLCNCNGTADVLSEQNRGPRASKPKIHNASERVFSVDDGSNSTHSFKIHNTSYNVEDFVTEYMDAKFFVIKSYSEDNIHKSIKYGIWASTPNGNRKLDAAYQEANDKGDHCPLFLLFSVNASAQFCGVAEMVGPVDFNRSFDYWRQDKWNGQFPVRWHIIKDVPNSQFRHIVLENNDNKPVTNSRDTQEVKLEQGIEMLGIFKYHKANTCILDDFEFYEERQKVIQEGKARQEAASIAAAASASAATAVVGIARVADEHKEEESNNVATTLPNDLFINKMAKTFAQVVHLHQDNNKQGMHKKDAAAAAASSVKGASVSTPRPG